MDTDINEIAMRVILAAGDGRQHMEQALAHVAKRDFNAAEAELELADAKILDAHKAQTSTIQAQAAGEDFEYSLLFTHAQDTLMTIAAEEHMVKHMMPIFKSLAQH